MEFPTFLYKETDNSVKVGFEFSIRKAIITAVF